MALFIINIQMDTYIYFVFTGFYMLLTGICINKPPATIKCQCCDNTPHWVLHSYSLFHEVFKMLSCMCTRRKSYFVNARMIGEWHTYWLWVVGDVVVICMSSDKTLTSAHSVMERHLRNFVILSNVWPCTLQKTIPAVVEAIMGAIPCNYDHDSEKFKFPILTN